MRKILIPTLILASISFTNSFANGIEKNNYQNFSAIYINDDKNPKLDVITYHNTNFINAGVLSRELGLNVEWKAPTVKITDKKNNVVKVSVGDVNIIKNDKKHLMYDAPFIKNDRVYVPLRTICEIFGYTVDFNTLDKTIKINTNSKDTTISSDKLEYDLSPNKRFGISSVKGVYVVPEESPESYYYSKIFLKDFNSGNHYKLGHTIASLKHIWTNDNKLIFVKMSDTDINSPYYKKEIFVVDPNNMNFIENKLEVKTAKYDKNTNTLYYSSDYKKYIAYNLNNYSKKEITKSQYEKINIKIYDHILV